MTGLKKTSDEVGSMACTEIFDLLDYWLDFPPEHVLLRAMAGYEGRKKNRKGNWSRRRERADEMQDEVYKPEAERPEATPEDVREATKAFGSARHSDCAPGHIQQAIERIKKNKHMEVPGAPAE